MTELVHYSPFAGSWYPADPAALRELLSDAFRHSRERTGPVADSSGVAFIAPHAGLQYSGVVAASVYRHIEAARAERVILFGFSHSYAGPGVAIPNVTEYITPLGAVHVDRDAANTLAQLRPFRIEPEQGLCDHSVEIQLPLLQSALPDASVLPLYVGDLARDEREQAADALLPLLDTRTVLLASTDFTHYGRDFGYTPFPVDARTPERLRCLDEELITAASRLDPDLFLDELLRSGSTLCGFNPVCLLLAILRSRPGRVVQRTLDYDTSAAVTKTYRHSVSYAALGYFPSPAPEPL